MSGNFNLGVDLSDDHPVSFVYDETLVAKDKGLYSPSVKDSGLGGTISEDLLVNNKMQCTSCHDVHNENGYPGLLIMDNTNSELCLTCHNK